MSMEEYKYKRQAITAENQLNYGEDVIKRLKAATTESEICRIMKTARESVA
jgi:uncharacterized 2Fe-2S/4Fe-4S cluster protein (DUF4445 family)